MWRCVLPGPQFVSLPLPICVCTSRRHCAEFISRTPGIIGRKVTRASLTRVTQSDNDTSTISRTFWSHPVRRVTLQEIKGVAAADRTIDRKSRFTVRGALQQTGVMSNLFPLHFVKNRTDDAVGLQKHGPLFVYDICVFRSQRANVGLTVSPRRRQRVSETQEGKKGEEPCGDRIPCSIAWRSFRRYFQHRFDSLPTLVQVDYHVYTIAPLPTDALQLPRNFCEINWDVAELRYAGRADLAGLPPLRLQHIVNRLVPWAMRKYREEHGGFDVVRDDTGKLVCTSEGISSGGIRVFKGVSIGAVFVDDTAAMSEAEICALREASVLGTLPNTVSSSHTSASLSLRGLSVGRASCENEIRFRVAKLVQVGVFKEVSLQKYIVEDTSGMVFACMWGLPKENTLKIGSTYAGRVSSVAAPTKGYQMRRLNFSSRFNLRELHGSEAAAVMTPVASIPAVGASCHDADKSSPQPSPSTVTTEPESKDHGSFPGQLALRIDTKGTVAAEASLWDEVRGRHGPGPYDDEAKRQIARSVEGTAVVISFSLRQATVRQIRFHTQPKEILKPKGATSLENVDMKRPPRPVFDKALLEIMPYLDCDQPLALLCDGGIVPLQVLHCCFDPRMKSWQDVVIPVLSFLPQKRMGVLEMFRAALEKQLQLWGLQLAAEPFRTRSLALLPGPLLSQRAASRSSGTSGHSTNLDIPTTIVVVGVAAASCTAELRQNIALTSQHLAQHFKTSASTCTKDVQDAVRFITAHRLVPSSSLAGVGEHQSPGAAAVIVTTDKHSRGTRWLMAECLTCGIIPVLVSPQAGKAKQALLCSCTGRLLRARMACDPLAGIVLANEVPALANKRLLVVGVDSCHTNVISTGSVVGALCTPQRNHVLSTFWKHDTRGKESQHVVHNFSRVLQRAESLAGELEEVVVCQDGDTFSEVKGMHEVLTACNSRCGLTFLCLHKRSNIRFIQEQQTGNCQSNTTHCNVVKGTVVPALAPVSLTHTSVAPSFFMQTHNSALSTARTVLYTIHHTSNSFPIADVQKVLNTMAHAHSPQATKLPLPTRCAHRLADQAERLLDAVPQLTDEMIPAPLNRCLWYL